MRQCSKITWPPFTWPLISQSGPAFASEKSLFLLAHSSELYLTVYLHVLPCSQERWQNKSQSQFKMADFYCSCPYLNYIPNCKHTIMTFPKNTVKCRKSQSHPKHTICSPIYQKKDIFNQETQSTEDNYKRVLKQSPRNQKWPFQSRNNQLWLVTKSTQNT